MKPVNVLVKIVTVTRNPNEGYRFLENMKSLEVGGEISALQESSDGWWTFDHTTVGKSRMKHIDSVEKYWIFDHIFVGGGLTWNVYARPVPNNEGSN